MVYAIMEISTNRTMTSSRSVFKTSDIDRANLMKQQFIFANRYQNMDRHYEVVDYDKHMKQKGGVNNGSKAGRVSKRC